MIKIGILHSQTGEMAISESALVDAALMAIDEINQLGGVLGEKIKPLIEDCESNPQIFAQKAQKLAEQGAVSLFGCWKSSCRKAVRPIVELYNLLLWYPLQYEGLEQSPNIFYTGSCLNQQIQPAVQWLLEQKRTRFYLLGSDYIFPWTANKLVKAQLEAYGGVVSGEDYVPLGQQSFEEIIHHIQATQPDVVFNTLNGASNLAFYRQFHEAGLKASEIPVMGVSVAEVELQLIRKNAAGHYCCWSYFQSLDLPSNHKFVRGYKKRFGADRVTSDPIEAAYSQLYLWKQSVEAAQSFETDLVRQAAYGQIFEAPGGQIQIDANHHAWKHCRIGQIQLDGQFREIFKAQGAIRPLPWLGIERVSQEHTPVVINLLSEVSDWIENKQQLIQTLSQVQQEVKQRQQAERQQELWKQVVNASHNPIVISNAQQVNMPLIYVNPAFEQQTGYTSTEIIGQNCRFLQQDDCDQPGINELRQAIRAQQNCTVILRNYRKDGTLFWNELAVSPVFDAEGSLTHYVGVQKDITERKAEEAKLQDALTCEKELSELKTEFISMASHEFRTPLATIFSSAELLEHYRHKWTEAKIHSHLLRIQSSTQHMTNLLNDVLLIGTVEAGKVEFNPVETNLVSFCGELVDELQISTQTHKIHFATGAEELLVNADQKLLRQIFYNLLSNAVKYSPGKSDVYFRIEGEPHEAVIEVRDEGIGIPPEDAMKVFNTFDRASNVGNISGTGLGLPIVKKSIEIHQGSIHLESEVNKGAKFIVRFPLSTKV